MSFDLGDPIPLIYTARDATGALTTVTAVVLTITLPDGSTVSPAVAAVSTGTYAPTTPYLSTQAGRHTVRWVGTAVKGLTDVFNVGPAAGSALVSMAEVKSLLNIASSDISRDEELRGVIAGVTPVIESFTGPIIQRVEDQWYDGGSPIIMLTKAPVVSVASVTETFGANVIRTLIYQPLDGITPVDAFGYTLDMKSGALIRRVSGVAAPFAAGRRNVHVVHTVGRSDVPFNVQEATKELVRVNWQPKRGASWAGGPLQQQASDSMSVDAGVVRMGYFVPNRVIEQLQPSQHAWGIA